MLHIVDKATFDIIDIHLVFMLCTVNGGLYPTTTHVNLCVAAQYVLTIRKQPLQIKPTA